jgi:secreted PhoX family phosphatase
VEPFAIAPAGQRRGAPAALESRERGSAERAVSPRGGLVLCEDGSGQEFLHGLTVEGDIFKFAQNNVLNGERNGFVGDYRGSEWAGACYSPDGRWLFANLQSPGITFAITGPWTSGAL